MKDGSLLQMPLDPGYLPMGPQKPLQRSGDPPGSSKISILYVRSVWGYLCGSWGAGKPREQTHVAGTVPRTVDEWS